jgi:hypothetical protein
VAQGARLRRAIECKNSLIEVTGAQRAGKQCEILNYRRLNRAAFDWFDGMLGA